MVQVRTFAIVQTTKRERCERSIACSSSHEGMTLSEESRERLRLLQSDETLTPAQRRAEVLHAYTDLPRKK
jgi:hypothetical protein